MVMTDSELATVWRQSNRDKAQVQVLADLNAVPTSVMVTKLVELGIQIPDGIRDLAPVNPGPLPKPEPPKPRPSDRPKMKKNTGRPRKTKTTGKARPPVPLGAETTEQASVMTASRLAEIFSEIAKSCPDVPVYTMDGKEIGSVLMSSAFFDTPKVTEVEVILMIV